MREPETTPRDFAADPLLRFVKPHPASPRGTRVEWRCRRCRCPYTYATSAGDGDYEDYRYTCSACGYSWVEEGADA